MFKLQFARYICDNMARLNLTYKDLAQRSGVPQTTISYYARGMVNTPSDDYCERIAAVFGDKPDVVQKMRREAIGSTAQENKIIAASDDKELMERLAGIIRANMLEVLDAYKTDVENGYTERLATVRAQYEKAVTDMERRCEEKLADRKAHFDALARKSEADQAKIDQQAAAANAYLKRMVRNLSIALVAVSLILGSLLTAVGLYAVYAYNTFDKQDPTRGLYQTDETPKPETIEAEALK